MGIGVSVVSKVMTLVVPADQGVGEINVIAGAIFTTLVVPADQGVWEMDVIAGASTTTAAAAA